MASQIYTLDLNWNSAGQFCSNILHYVFDDSGYSTTAQAAQALINRWIAVSQSSWLNMLPTAVIQLSAKARKATGVGGFEAVTLFASSVTGTRTGGMSASGLSPVLVHYPLNRRLGRGRTFLPGLSETDGSAGVFTNAYKGAVGTAINNAFADLVLVGGGTPTAEFVVKQRSGSPGWWSVGTTVLSDLLGQQRRRQRPS